MELHDECNGKEQECIATVQHCHRQIDRLSLMLMPRTTPKVELYRIDTPPDLIDKWLNTGNWRALPKIAATAAIILILLVNFGCSTGQVVRVGPCQWHTSVQVAGPDGHPELTATGVCRGKLWGIAPLGGSMRCTASIDLPGVATRTDQ